MPSGPIERERKFLWGIGGWREQDFDSRCDAISDIVIGAAAGSGEPPHSSGERWNGDNDVLQRANELRRQRHLA
jgi:hypothetical protein